LMHWLAATPAVPSSARPKRCLLLPAPAHTGAPPVQVLCRQEQRAAAGG
jgi:hypothetical protein